MNPSDKYSVLNNALFSMPLSPFSCVRPFSRVTPAAAAAAALCVCVCGGFGGGGGDSTHSRRPVAAKMFRHDDEGWEQAAGCVSMR